MATMKPAEIVKIDKNNGNFIVTLTQDSFCKDALDLTSSGYFLDVLALSADRWENNELWENNFDYSDSSTDYVLDNWNYEEGYLQALNNGKMEKAVDGGPCVIEVAIMNPEHRAAMLKSDLLPGAYFALNFPCEFQEGLKDYEEKLREQATECTGDYNTDCKELNDRLLNAYDDAQEELNDQWLHGDRHDGGVLQKAREKHGFDSCLYYEGKGEKGEPGRIVIEVSPEWVRESKGEEDSYRVTRADALEEVTSTIVCAARKYSEAERARKEKRSAEWKRTREYQKAREEEKEKARIERLKGMKKS